MNSNIIIVGNVNNVYSIGGYENIVMNENENGEFYTGNFLRS